MFAILADGPINSCKGMGPHQEGRHIAVCLFAHTKHSQKAGPFSVARLKMDLPFLIVSRTTAFTGEVPASPFPTPAPATRKLRKVRSVVRRRGQATVLD